jgi:predicted amidohydrolase
MFAAAAPAGELEWDGWRPYSPRDEIRPVFAVDPHGGPDGRGGLLIQLAGRPGLDGAWARTFEVEGGAHYRITAHGQMDGIENPRFSTYVEVLFHDDEGRLVPDPDIRPRVVGRILPEATSNYFVGKSDVQSRPFYLPVVGTDGRGWTKFSDVFRAPAAATRATVKLHLRWESEAQVQWGGLSFVESEPRPARKVRLAAANVRPRGGKTAMDNLRQLEPHIAEAAEQRADLLVLGECITSVGNGLTYLEAAEPVPGPSTRFLSELAEKYGLYLVTTIHERVDHLVYNTAVLIDPEGELVGTYRKVCLARDEYRQGVAAGCEYPVFDTPLGKIGMMICFDVTEPEVARGLGANGAEIIAMPIMGGHPALARARAIENQVYLVTSSYSINDDWMQSGVWGLNGEMLARATEKDSVVVAEVDLAERHFWPGNMGEMRGRLRHERTAAPLPK